MFVDSDLKIVSQIVLPIQYCLAAMAVADIRDCMCIRRRWRNAGNGCSSISKVEIFETSSNAVPLNWPRKES